MAKRDLIKCVVNPLLTSLAFARNTSVVATAINVRAESTAQTTINQYTGDMVKFFNKLDAYNIKIKKAKTEKAHKEEVQRLMNFLRHEHPTSDEIAPKYGTDIVTIHGKFVDFVISLHNVYNLICQGSDEMIAEEVLYTVVKEAGETSFSHGVRYSESLANYIEKNKFTPSKDLRTKSNESTIYIVKKGDSLFKIAKQYNTSVVELQKMNGLYSHQLLINQALVVKSSRIVSTLPKDTAKVTVSVLNIRSSDSMKDKVIGTINKGSTVTVVSIRGKWARVQYGKIIGYVRTEYIQMDAIARQSSKPVTRELTTNTYSVKKGDTLNGISTKYNVAVTTLKSLNGLKNERIYVNQVLKLQK